MTGISDELRDKIRLAISDPSHFLKRGDESVPAWATRAVVSLLDEAGVAVVDLPEPDDEMDGRAYWRSNSVEIATRVNYAGLAVVDDGPRVMNADYAEAHALAVVAAARWSKRQLAATQDARVADGGAR